MLPQLLAIPALSVLILLAAVNASAEEDVLRQHNGTAWDNAVNSLLAAGMYGFDGLGLPGLSLQLQRSTNLYKGLAADKARINGQAISFSYEGSSGLLGFSAGYIYTSRHKDDEPGTVFLGIDPTGGGGFDPARSWYMALDLSRSYEVDDHFTLGVGNRLAVMQNPFNTQEGQVFSMLFNMPISYKNYLTITPELQWSRSLAPLDEQNATSGAVPAQDKAQDDVFYGGVSISFSY